MGEDEYMQEATGRSQWEGVADGVFVLCGSKTAVLSMNPKQD
jgi:hypothetical protein